jgi:DNA replication and repair protein RecF
MIVTHIEAENVRSFKQIEGSFAKNLITIIGPNGSGKTNLLEVLYFSLFAKGLRSSTDTDMIYNQSEFLRTQVKYQKDGINKTIKVILKNDNTKDLTFNGRINEKLITLFYESNAIYFSPGSSQLIKGGPIVRKNFLDRLSMKLNREFSLIVSKYAQTLKNRNVLIKRRLREEGDDNLYEILTHSIIDFSKIIQEERKKMIALFNDSIHQSVSIMDVPNLSDIKIQYSPYLISPRNIAQLKLEEVRRGISTIGSHLDQIYVKKGSFDAKNYCSEGEQKIIAFLFKLCEFQLIEKNTKNIPIFLLDDLYSELDDQNAKKVLDYLVGKSQIFLTTLHEPAVQSDQVINLTRNQEELWIQ